MTYDPYQELANAIIVRAAKDYMKALKHPKNTFQYTQRSELESFFRSSMYAILTDVDGEVLMQNIEKMVVG